ncbi:hypothetical protein UlMin_013577 [Ulmus minor]
MSPAANSSRWCPTPEQLMILEEMYRSGTRTPNASQIQQITTHLSFYGKIEGKNVFYWFQNHKARDRQKLRRKLLKQLQQQQVLYHHNNPQNHHFHGYCTRVEDDLASNHQLMNYSSWKVGNIRDSKKLEMEKPKMMRIYDRDWLMMMDMGPLNSPCCNNNYNNNRPLKTLQLFPITATNLKEEFTTTASTNLQDFLSL